MNNEWSLDVLYKGFDDPAFIADFKAVDTLIEESHKLSAALSSMSEKEGILVPYYEGQSIRIIDGPLRDMVGEIVGFDVHKRKAMIRTELFGGSVLHVGIDLLKAFSVFHF